MAAPSSSDAAQTVSQSLQTAFDSGIWYNLCLWPALKVAVENNWGGANSAEKRDWFAGAVSDIFTERPDTDQMDLEAVLLQVMQDEFDVNVEDESEVPVAAAIIKLWAQIQEGDGSGVELVRQRWGRRKGKKEAVNVVDNHAHEHDDDIDEEDESEDDDEDVDMGDAPPPVVREKQEPEVDEDGFTKVVSKKKR